MHCAYNHLYIPLSHCICKLVVLILYSFVLMCSPEDGNLLLKHVGVFIYVDNL